MLLRIPTHIVIRIVSFISIKQIFQDCAVINKKFKELITQNEEFMHQLAQIYFKHDKIDNVKYFKKGELPFWGTKTDGHCIRSEQWIDQLFTRTLGPIVVLQNCKYIDACLSDKATEFKINIYKMQKLFSTYLNYQPQQRIQFVSLKHLYRKSFELSQAAFNITNPQEKNQIINSLHYFWDRNSINQSLIDHQTQQEIECNYIGVLRSITLSIIPRRNQTPKVLEFSTDSTITQPGEIIRTNIEEIRNQAQIFDNKCRTYEFAIYQSPGPFLLIKLYDTYKIKIHFSHYEAPVLSKMRIKILEYNGEINGELGCVFQYISCSGYIQQKI